jgi:hypothetical protein
VLYRFGGYGWDLGKVKTWRGRKADRTWDVYFPGVPRGDEWKLALGVDTRGEAEEEDMWVLLT